MMFRALSFTLAPLLITGCVDPWQVGVIGIRKVFRVPVDAISVEPPTPSIDYLIGEAGMPLVLRSAGMPQDEVDRLEASGIPLTDLAALGAIVSLEPYAGGIEGALIAAMQAELDDRARESIADNDLVSSFESDWSAWADWELDLGDVDASLVEGLCFTPVIYRVMIEADSLSELVGGDAGPVTEQEMLKAVFLREVGLRTLLPEEVEPADGWPAEEMATKANRALTDPGRVDHCVDGQTEIDQTLGARIHVVALDDPSIEGTLAEMSEVDSRSACGFVVPTDDRMNLKPYLDRGVRLNVELELAPGTQVYDLGGYILTGAEARARVPGSFLEL